MKYKHKKTGYIAVETISEKNYRVTEPKNFTVPKWIIENSDDWKPVEEPEFIILEFIDAQDKDIIYHIGHDMYSRENGTPSPLEQQLKWIEDGYRKIHKVKRLSDNKIFTTGDKIEFNCMTIKEITEISLDENPDNKSYRRETPYLVCGKNYGISLFIAKKAKQPLFTTFDGINIFEGDTIELYLIAKMNSVNIKHCIKKEVKPGSFSQFMYYFSTEEAAQEYIDNNKPRYSKKQILDIIDRDGDEYSDGECIDDLFKLIGEKYHG